MPQWFLRFSEFPKFTEFNESSAPFRENSIETGFPYYLLWAIQQKAVVKICSWIQCEISEDFDRQRNLSHSHFIKSTNIA